MVKIVVIVNGKGGVGKDTFCHFTEKIFRIMNISSIDPIFNIAYAGGWNGVKDEKGRLLLSELKIIFNNYNNLTREYVWNKYQDFLAGDKEILFIHIREPEEIKIIKEKIKIRCITLLINGERELQKYGNMSDDNTENYSYDFYYQNNNSLQEMEQEVINFWNNFFNKD